MQICEIYFKTNEKGQDILITEQLIFLCNHVDVY